jgi:hypothetical protein
MEIVPAVLGALAASRSATLAVPPERVWDVINWTSELDGALRRHLAARGG